MGTFFLENGLINYYEFINVYLYNQNSTHKIVKEL
jgi:hypothetical protein